jgi:AbrB family looped-hinge helix DNA binding protein
MTISVRVQEKGQITIPTIFRKKLNLRKGDLVTFVETTDGVLIKPAAVILKDALDELGSALKADGITLEDLMERSHKIREQLVEEMYGLKEK